jgi:hypothetical protein
MQKFPQKFIGKVLLLLGFLILPLAEAQTSQATNQPTNTSVNQSKRTKRPQQRDAYRAELAQVLESNAVACEKDDDCDALGVGSMACGGPSEYVPVAKATLAKVQAQANDLVTTITELDQTKNKERGAFGICLALVKPKLSCSAGKCEAAK